MMLGLALLALIGSACSSVAPVASTLPLAQGRPTLLFFFTDN